jgi:hypothetical protein
VKVSAVGQGVNNYVGLDSKNRVGYLASMQISTDDQYRLALAVRCHARTVRRWLEGETVNGPTAVALEAAAKRLKINAWAGMDAKPALGETPDTAAAEG